MSIHQTRPVTASIVTILTDAGLLVGAGQQPTGAGGDCTDGSFRPWAVIHPMRGGDLDGSLGLGQEDAEALYQITCVGATQEQAEWVADTARIALLAATPTAPGRAVVLVVIDELGGSTRDDDAQPPLWFIADRYRLLTTPA